MQKIQSDRLNHNMKSWVQNKYMMEKQVTEYACNMVL